MKKFLDLRLNRFVPFGLIALAAAVLLAPAPASATPYVVKLVQQGSNVVATGRGEFDLTGLTFAGHSGPIAKIWPSDGFVKIGPSGIVTWDDEYCGLTGPGAFGSGSYTLASTGSGDDVAVDGFGDRPPSLPVMLVPGGYVSGSTLSSSATWDNASFASLGVTPGTYVWSWGSAADQTFTLIIGNAISAPEPAVFGMFGLGLLLIGGFVGLRRRVA